MGLTNVTKATTPRVSQQDKTTTNTPDKTIEMMEQVRSGKIDIAKMNQEISSQREEEHDRGLKAVLDS